MTISFAKVHFGDIQLPLGIKSTDSVFFSDLHNNPHSEKALC